MSSKNLSKKLTILIAALVAAFLLFSLSRLMAVNGVRTGSYINPNVASEVVEGTIFDRNGKILSAGSSSGRTYPQNEHALFLIQETENIYSDYIAPHPGYEEPTTYGDSIYLTIDSDIQYLLDKAVQDLSVYQTFYKAFGFIIDAHTGEVLALLDGSLPSEIGGIKTKLVMKTTDISGKTTSDKPKKTYSSDAADFLKIYRETAVKNIEDKYLVYLGTSNGLSKGIDQTILNLRAGLKSQSKL